MVLKAIVVGLFKTHLNVVLSDYGWIKAIFYNVHFCFYSYAFFDILSWIFTKKFPGRFLFNYFLKLKQKEEQNEILVSKFN